LSLSNDLSSELESSTLFVKTVKDVSDAFLRDKHNLELFGITNCVNSVTEIPANGFK
jgi:hypothetical protein